MLGSRSRLLAIALLIAISPASVEAASGHGTGARHTPPRLIASSATPMSGQVVELRVLNAGPGASFEWDVSGEGPVTSGGDGTARIGLRLRSPGLHRVLVRITGDGNPRALSLTLSVRGRPSKKARARGRHRRVLAPRATRHPAARTTFTARVARDPGVGIADFRFTPGTTTIRVGDALTWTNDGPSPHTATARNGSFDTGVLQKGQSASHTFNQPGTFSYFCTIHPFMHGTVVVLAAATTPSSAAGASQSQGASSNSTSTTGTSGSTTGASASTTSSAALPVTGVSISALVATGLLLAAAGLLLRRLVGYKEERPSPEVEGP